MTIVIIKLLFAAAAELELQGLSPINELLEIMGPRRRKSREIKQTIPSLERISHEKGRFGMK